MPYADNFDDAAKFARQALVEMVQRGIAPHPNNFALWYAYVSNTDAELRRTMEQAMSSGLEFSEAVCAQLFATFIANTAKREVRVASDHANQTLERAADVLQNASLGMGEYSKALSHFSGGLVEAAQDESLHPLVRAVLTETRQMAATNRELQDRLIQSTSEIVNMRRNLDELRREAITDSLTGIHNRKLFDVVLRDSTREAAAAGGKLSLLMVDIDHFKNFNDRWGHQLGDQVLRLVAHSMVEAIKGQDTAARYGGEEFAVILPGTKLREATKVAEFIRKTVAAKKIVNRRTGQSLGNITLSIGVAEYAAGEEPYDLVSRADAALYLAKNNGRNRVANQTELPNESASQGRAAIEN